MPAPVSYELVAPLATKGVLIVIELKLSGRTEDGVSLLFEDDEGNSYLVRPTNKLRTELARTQLAVAPAPTKTKATPGQIQSLLRQGMSPTQVADEIGSDPERVLRYYSPIADEIHRAVTTAQASKVGPETDSPLMGELIVDRLASRGVDPADIQWKAARLPGEDWVVTISFPAGDTLAQARWTLPRTGGRPEALDDTARELTETVELAPPIDDLFATSAMLPRTRPRRTEDSRGPLETGPISTGPIPTGSSSPETGAVGADVKRQEELVDILNRARGRFTPILDDVTELDEQVDLEIEEELPSGQQTLLRVVEERHVEAHTQTEHAAQPPAPRSSSRSKRKPMPSWDEIVFGSKTD